MMLERVMEKSSGTRLEKSFASLILILTVLIAAILGSFYLILRESQTVNAEKPYVGVAFCGNTPAEARL
jgi:hypothetical protein